MQIQVVKSSEVTFDDVESCLVVPVFERVFPLNSEVLREQDELTLQALVDKGSITGKARECFYVPSPNSLYHGVLSIGLGKKEDFTAETLRRAAGKACSLFSANRVQHVCLDVSRQEPISVEAFVEGVILGQYSFDVYKRQEEDAEHPPVKVEKITLAVANDADVEAIRIRCQLAAVMCLSANGARHLANTAANEMTPTALAEFAQGIAKEAACDCYVMEREEMEKRGMNALLGVAKGSSQPPKLIILHYRHSDASKTLALVGKGVTFDAGGLSLKPSNGMHEMKYDMCGAAAVLCTMMNVVELKPAVNVICVVPAVENKTGADAQTPGDIVRACNGTTIEVHNTDAEGRLVLADAMAYTVEEYHPDVLVDVATLTGACVVALGHYAAGLFTNNEDVCAALQAAGTQCDERVWPLPMWPDYEKLIEGEHADLCNIGPQGEAGTITAACFLKKFVDDTPWAHIDIAGTAWGGKNIDYLNPKFATGYGVRLLTHWLLAQAK